MSEFSTSPERSVVNRVWEIADEMDLAVYGQDPRAADPTEVIRVAWTDETTGVNYQRELSYIPRSDTSTPEVTYLPALFVANGTEERCYMLNEDGSCSPFRRRTQNGATKGNRSRCSTMSSCCFCKQ